MTDTTVTIAQLTLAATNTPAMVRFYDAVFGTQLQPIDAYGTTLYRGTLHDMPFVICPNDLAGVEAQKSRHQFSYIVSDVAAMAEQAIAAGGTVDQQAQDDGDSRTRTLLDPDGNSIVLIQASA